MKIAGYIWLVTVGAALVYLLTPLIAQPSLLEGPAAAEYWDTQLFFALLLSLPGALMVPVGSRRKEATNQWRSVGRMLTCVGSRIQRETWV